MSQVAKEEEYREPFRCEAVFRLKEDDYPKRNCTTIVITDAGDKVHIGVKALTRVFERNEDGSIKVYEEQHGDICTVSKDAPLGCLFDSLKELFESVPETIDKVSKAV